MAPEPHLDTERIHKLSQQETERYLSEITSNNQNGHQKPKPNDVGSIWAAAEEDQADIPPDSFFAALPSDDHNDAAVTKWDDVPSIETCAVHLELLETFLVLQNKVLRFKKLDATFGIARHFQSPASLSKLREEKWKKFLKLAVARFNIWIEHVWEEGGEWSENGGFPGLPPIDVLMVLHSFMLNPKEFGEFCSAEGNKVFAKLRFPWKRIHESLDIDAGGYRKGIHMDPSATDFKIHPDLFDYLRGADRSMSKDMKKLLKFPASNTWTGVSRASNTSTANEQILLSLLSSQTACPTDKVIDLSAAVQRQTVFISKMSHYLWLRSPSLYHALTHARTRYTNFFALFALHPGNIIVPTFDVDLVWHTQQLDPSRYREYCDKIAGRFINHDDKIGKGELGSTFEETKRLYFESFGEVYDECLCWDCAAVREAVERDGPKDEAEMEVVMRGAREKVARYRVMEIRRQAGAVRSQDEKKRGLWSLRTD
ncbi:hypothetical protein K402DRAFT_347332 [Aulographum hederae CBS 113979]|uniref:Uncharacterized protein n=1 Tax=Aulographum hederae CBS 113979 TaxID=1176131 RepID=A0A6G1HDW6_9PEZI|nr:hypothetical protein K402DRAFT_347332 [Aulographum hederae CBS 113979]